MRKEGGKKTLLAATKLSSSILKYVLLMCCLCVANETELLNPTRKKWEEKVGGGKKRGENG